MNDDERVVSEILAGTGLRREDDGWALEVLARLEPEAPRRSSAWRRWLSVSVPVAAAAALALVIVPPDPGSVGDEAAGVVPLRGLEVRRVEVAPGLRGDELHPGDVVSIRAPLPDSRRWELWAYRDARELVLRCPGSEGCTSAGSELRARLELPSVGSFQLLLVGGTPRLPPPTGRLDADVSAVVEAGGTVSLRHRLEAR